VAIWLAAASVLAALVLIAPRSERPEDILALPRYLANMGLEVVERAQPPPPGGTLILVNDLRDAREARSLLRWAGRGGTLVVADPNSVILSLTGASPNGPVGVVGAVELEPRCLAPEVVGVERVLARASDLTLQPNHDGFVACFPAGEGAFLLTRRYGAGRVTLLGGFSPFTNEMLRDADNAVLAVQVAGPGPDVVFGPPVPGMGAEAPRAGVWSLLPDRARVVVIAVIVAVVALALVRARRLGRPVLEEPVAPIPASELVRATGRMYRRARTAAYCGRLLRDATVGRLSRRLGGAGRTEDLPRVLAHAGRVPEDRVREILRGPDPRSDEDLIQLGRELEELTARTKRRTGDRGA
jgi:hypothetical protein